MNKFNSFQELGFLKNQNDNQKRNPQKIQKENRIRQRQRSLFQNNYFLKYLFEDKETGFKTVFTDEQVINIIEKISNRNIRKILWEFQRIRFSKADRYFQLKYILHTICMKLFRRYGGKMMSFIIDLPIISRPDEVTEILPDLYSLNLEKEDLNFESFRAENNNSKLNIGFEFSEFTKKPYMIICNTKGYLYGRINELGYIEDEFINRIKFNIFKFMDGAEYFHLGAVLNCYCCKCKQELTVPESIYYGVGPICRSKYSNVIDTNDNLNLKFPIHIK